MFGSKKDTICDAYNEFMKVNKKNFGDVGIYPDNDLLFASFIESRLTNNLLLLSNPDLCSNLNLNSENLYKEITILTEIRQRITDFTKEDIEKTR